MRTSEERIAELHHRMNLLKQAKSKRRYRMICTAAYAACLAVTVLLTLGVSRLSVQTNGSVSDSVTGSIFAAHEALGHIVVALIALCLGVLVTVFCFRLKRRMDEKDKNDG